MVRNEKEEEVVEKMVEEVLLPYGGIFGVGESRRERIE